MDIGNLMDGADAFRPALLLPIGCIEVWSSVFLMTSALPVWSRGMPYIHCLLTITQFNNASTCYLPWFEARLLHQPVYEYSMPGCNVVQ